MTKIVILGGGFAGLTAALNLEKRFGKAPDVSLALIDKEPYHLFNGNLYEVATAPEELVTIKNLKASVALPFKQILQNKPIKFIQSEAKAVDVLHRTVLFANKKIEYDYLILAQGSCEECFNIPGAQTFGIPLKSLAHALKIKNAVEFAVESRKLDAQKRYARIIIAGGGYTGVELAGELKGLIDFLAWKHGIPRQKLEIEIIEASNSLMPGMGERASKDALARLDELGIRVKLLSPIVKVNQNTLELLTGEALVYDVLIWTVGVRAKDFPQGLRLKLDQKGRALVDEFLRAKNFHNIFVLGDQAAVYKKSGQAVPSSAQDAIYQGQYLAYALPALLKNQRPEPYVPKTHGFIVNLGGKWAILNYPPFYFTGWLAYFIHELASLRYFASLLGWWQALKLVWMQDRLYERNN